MFTELRFDKRMIVIWVLLLLLSQTTHAHLLALDQSNALRIADHQAYLRISIPVELLSGMRQQNGMISAQDLTVHRLAWQKQLDQRIRLLSNGNPGQLVFEELTLAEDELAQPGDGRHLILLRSMMWPDPVQSMQMQVDLFGDDTAHDTRIDLKVVKGQTSELVIFSQQHTSAQLFGSAWSTLLRFIDMGCEHILLGPDHLLFLFTVLVVAAGWRYWLSVVTSFTAAHSITLTLGALNIVSISPALIEPLIATSIVLMAIDNLWRRSHAIHGRIVLVFACGLLHGLGFASGLQELGLSGQYRVWSLLGFNLGVELGQAIFLATLLGITALAKRTRFTVLPEKLMTIVGSITVVLGMVMLVQRI